LSAKLQSLEYTFDGLRPAEEAIESDQALLGQLDQLRQDAQSLDQEPSWSYVPHDSPLRQRLQVVTVRITVSHL